MTSFNDKSPSATALEKARGIYVIIPPIISFVVTLVLSFFLTFFINDFPRKSMGEAVLIPWAYCLTGAIAFQVLVPSLSLFFLLKNKKLSAYYFICFLISVIICYFFIGPVMYKAWNRGL